MSRYYALTFDIDLFDYISGGSRDEVMLFFSRLDEVIDCPWEFKATWFIRLDSQLSTLFSRPDYLLTAYADLWRELEDKGHELAWHHHAYEMAPDGHWRPNTVPVSVCRDLELCLPAALRYGFRSVRLGWGFQSNETMKFLDEAGFMADSSAIPRPNYHWAPNSGDWSLTPLAAYRPSLADYRVPGLPALSIVEVPLTTVPLQVPTDTENSVRRYINPAYSSEYFQLALRQAEPLEIVTLICHPYEVLPHPIGHQLVAFDFEFFLSNLHYLHRLGLKPLTISEVAARLMEKGTPGSRPN